MKKLIFLLAVFLTASFALATDYSSGEYKVSLAAAVPGWVHYDIFRRQGFFYKKALATGQDLKWNEARQSYVGECGTMNDAPFQAQSISFEDVVAVVKKCDGEVIRAKPDWDFPQI